ncbi:hypothetical protein PROFUN_06192 [Planoprotostelium fungivorum]|uniref:Uncharacterized protein n=1 Tax=Planoprotostelium fungivorum TaxID=1890364 RepID=A0A2P6MYZ2_9EUKA|nr:hypothetical protein PROFUN_06192 [Planoprotostelium fungivorum]
MASPNSTFPQDAPQGQKAVTFCLVTNPYSRHKNLALLGRPAVVRNPSRTLRNGEKSVKTQQPRNTFNAHSLKRNTLSFFDLESIILYKQRLIELFGSYVVTIHHKQREIYNKLNALTSMSTKEFLTLQKLRSNKLVLKAKDTTPEDHLALDILRKRVPLSDRDISEKKTLEYHNELQSHRRKKLYQQRDGLLENEILVVIDYSKYYPDSPSKLNDLVMAIYKRSRTSITFALSSINSLGWEGFFMVTIASTCGAMAAAAISNSSKIMVTASVIPTLEWRSNSYDEPRQRESSRSMSL